MPKVFANAAVSPYLSSVQKSMDFVGITTLDTTWKLVYLIWESQDSSGCAHEDDAPLLPCAPTPFFWEVVL